MTPTGVKILFWVLADIVSLWCYVVVLGADLEEAAEVVQGALGPQEAPGQNGADLLTHGVEVGDESVRHLRQTADATELS